MLLRAKLRNIFTSFVRLKILFIFATFHNSNNYIHFMIFLAIDTAAQIEKAVHSLLDHGMQLGYTLIKALIVFMVGRLLINLVNKLVIKILSKRNIDTSIKTFVGSLVNVSLTILLIISVVGALGVQTTSFAALLASAGVAVGMALSGNLSNFAGGLIILLFKPYRVGDYIEAQGIGGTVQGIQMFHTIINTADNKVIYIPNGSLSSGVVTNFSKQPLRRVDWTIGVEYDTDYDRVKQVIEQVLAQDARILNDPAPFIALAALADSSVNITVRAWVKKEDYWGVFFDINQAIYATFNREGIGFPFPQLTVHKA